MVEVIWGAEEFPPDMLYRVHGDNLLEAIGSLVRAVIDAEDPEFFKLYDELRAIEAAENLSSQVIERANEREADRRNVSWEPRQWGEWAKTEGRNSPES